MDTQSKKGKAKSRKLLVAAANSVGTKRSAHARQTRRSLRAAELEAKLAQAALDKVCLVFTDGACSGNPGPAGLGVWCAEPRLELSTFLGEQLTNNIAELKAIEAACLWLANQGTVPRHQTIWILTDSSYVHGLLTLGWHPSKNQELVLLVQEAWQSARQTFPSLELVLIPGHARIHGNEQADRLAVLSLVQ